MSCKKNEQRQKKKNETGRSCERSSLEAGGVLHAVLLWFMMACLGKG